MKIIKAIINLKRIRSYVMKNSFGCLGYSFHLNFTDGIGRWIAKINRPLVKGDSIDVDTIEENGETWYEAVNRLASKI